MACMQTKTCKKCSATYPLTAEFFTRRLGDGSRLGFRSCCKRCNHKVRFARNTAPENKDAHRLYMREYSRKYMRKRRAAGLVPPYRPDPNRRRTEFSKKNDRAHYERNKFSKNFASHVRYSLKGKKNRAPWESLVGYAVGDLRKHIERQFRKGMTWDNRGSVWELDHIVPLASFKIDGPNEDFRAAWALTNLRPLPKRENTSKHAKRTHLL